MEAVLTKARPITTTHGHIIQQETEEPRFSRRTLAAMEEAKRISRDPNVPSYKTMEDLIQALEAD